MGWFGWTYEQTIAHDPNAIELAQLGRLEMFETMGFIKREKPRVVPKGADGQPLKITPAAFDALFGKGNQRVH